MVRFELLSDAALPPAPLTVVIDTGGAIVSATAEHTSAQTLTVSIRGQRILLDVAPSAQPVTVRWQSSP
jgi:hypothetical protein